MHDDSVIVHLEEARMAVQKAAAVDEVTLEAFLRKGVTYSKPMPADNEVLVVDFFSGAGGMTSGMRATRSSNSKITVVAAVDIDRVALQSLVANTGVLGLCIDIRKLAETPELLLQLVPELNERPNGSKLVFVGCPPCQGFSAHRKKDTRDDPRNDLASAFAKLVSHFRPDAVVMENVPEFFHGRFEHYFEEAASILRKAGYRLTEATLDLSDYGVPQRRKRAIVLGALGSAISVPETPDLVSERSVRDAISHLTPIVSGGVSGDDPWHRAPAHIQRILERIHLVPHDGGDLRDLTAEQQLACHVSMRERNTSGFSDVYGRLRWDRASVTITAKSSTPSCGRFLHPEQDRNISVREAALLQGFPQNYVFAGGLVHQYRQIGEAVPPLFARFIAKAVLDSLEGRQSSTVALERVSSAMSSSYPDAPFVAVDLFAGAGGLSLGLLAAGVQTVYAADIDVAAVATYKKNIGDEANVVDLRSDGCLVDISDAVAGRPFVVVGGPPCQGFSQQRRGNDVDERNDLVLRFGEIALGLDVKPFAIVLENVMYLDSPRGREVLVAYEAQMRAAGYSTRRFEVNSADHGVPQTRRRLIVVATRQSSNFELHSTSRDRWVTVGEAFNSVQRQSWADPNGKISNETAVTRRRLGYVDMGKGRTAIPDALQLDCHRGYDGHLDVFGRLDWFGLARTVTGGFDSASRGEYGHPFINRSITAREAATLQGFPSSFVFEGNRSEVRHQIGNAVPPPLGYSIGVTLMNLAESEGLRHGRAA